MRTSKLKALQLTCFLPAVLAYSQTTLLNIKNDGLLYVDADALMYTGGGLSTAGSGRYDIHGNVILLGQVGDAIQTRTQTNQDKQDGGNIILRLNDPSTFANSTYGQLYIKGFTQSNLTAIIDKEHRTNRHGVTDYYQQLGLPFYNKTIESLSLDLSKPFSGVRWSKNEILHYNNNKVISDHFTSVANTTIDATGYYMLGSKNNDLDLSSKVYTLRGRPYADQKSVALKGAGQLVNFGTGGNNLNQYREPYNTYLQDFFDYSAGPWEGNYGKNIYQFGNPFFTNLDLSKIGYVESASNGDDNQIQTIKGIRYDPGEVRSLPNGATYSSGALLQTFITTPGPTQGMPVGDVGLIIKPMGTFVIKLTAEANNIIDPAAYTLNFDTLRRFEDTIRDDDEDYSVNRNQSATVKQLAVKALDANKNEIARTYYVVYPQAVTGRPGAFTTQVTNPSSAIIGTYEEDPNKGGYDSSLTSSYWLYINEANEQDFQGKAIPMVLYSDQIKFLQFEVKENAKTLPEGTHLSSQGIGFNFKSANENLTEITSGQIVPVRADEYSLFYGVEKVLAPDEATKPHRTFVTYNALIQDHIVRFDPSWSRAEIQVFDMAGRLVHSKINVHTKEDYVLSMLKANAAYVIVIKSASGQIINTKLLK